MVFLQYRIKNGCAICGKRFQTFYCKVCRRKEFGLCNSCHNQNKSHKEEMRGLKHV